MTDFGDKGVLSDHLAKIKGKKVFVTQMNTANLKTIFLTSATKAITEF